MRILMIAPQPFFEPRGTPFSEYHRIRTLISLGHTVDLVTYPFGQDISIAGLRVFRSARPPFLNSVRIGPSLAKVPLDVLLAFEAIRRALQNSYDVVHSHEEGVVVGVLLAKLMKVPHLYDMHSSLPQQFSNFGFSRSKILDGIFGWIEKIAIRWSRVVIVICPYLKEVVRAIDADATIVLIENAPGAGDSSLPEVSGDNVRSKLGLPDESVLVLYTGTFEAYQGLDLLLALPLSLDGQKPKANPGPGMLQKCPYTTQELTHQAGRVCFAHYHQTPQAEMNHPPLAHSL
jgi:glycosyltransferase involved in cell wall biosynthesis